MSRKKMKVDKLLEAFAEDDPAHDPHYLGFFRCFNQQLYYEAHEVLERLWLHSRGGPEAAFYQGLIQLAGAFVHLQKDRLGPAARLFRLALKNFSGYPDLHAGLNLQNVRALCEGCLQQLEKPGAPVNPWSTQRAPQLTLN